MLRVFSTILRTFFVTLLLFIIWQIGSITTSRPKQIIPDNKASSINQNPLFIYSYKNPNSLLVDCTVEPYLESWEGIWLKNTTAASGEYILMYPEEKFGEGEGLTSGFLRSCYLKPFLTDNKHGALLFYNKYLVKKYDVGDSEYSQEGFNDIISNYSDLSVAVRKIEPQRTSPFKKN